MQHEKFNRIMQSFEM